MASIDWRKFGHDLTQQNKAKSHAIGVADIANVIMRVPDNQIENRLTSGLTSKELSAAIDVSIIKNAALIDPEVIYCNVTGQPIGRRNPETLKLAIQIHGVSRVEELTKFSAQSAIAEHWIAQNGRDLSALAEADPFGYFVFAASFAYRRFYANLVDQKDALKAENELQLLKQKIILYSRVTQIDLETIIRANEAWRNFLSLIDPAVARDEMRLKLQNAIAFPCASLVDFAQPSVVEFLQFNLTKIIAHLVYRETAYKRRVSPADIARMADKYKGLSVFRSQRRISNENEQDFIASLLAENTVNHLPIGNSDKSHGSSWQRREAEQHKRKSQFSGQAFTPDKSKPFVIKLSAAKVPSERAAGGATNTSIPAGMTNKTVINTNNQSTGGTRNAACEAAQKPAIKLTALVSKKEKE